MEQMAKNKKVSSLNNFYREKTIWLLHNKQYEKIELSSITYVESADGIIYIHTDQKVYPFSASLNSFERQTNVSFFARISRKYLININKTIAFNLKDHQLAFNVKDRRKWLPIGPSYRTYIYSFFTKLKSD